MFLIIKQQHFLRARIDHNCKLNTRQMNEVAQGVLLLNYGTQIAHHARKKQADLRSLKNEQPFNNSKSRHAG